MLRPSSIIIAIAIVLALCSQRHIYIDKLIISDDESSSLELSNRVLSSFAGQKYLVVCIRVDNSLLPMFTNFTVIRLRMGEDPPPWNTTAFLHVGEGQSSKTCRKHRYVKEAMERRKNSPFLVARNLPWANNHDDVTPDASSWVHGVRWPNYRANSTTHLRAIRDRPAIIETYGEVFWREQYKKQSCSDVDFMVYREVETALPDCLQIHFIQGVSTTMYRGVHGKFGLRNTADIFEKAVAHPHKQYSFVDYKKFCSFMVRFNSTSPAHMFNNTRYDTDGFIRHTFFLLLSEYRPCERITDCGVESPYEAFKCMVGYKFHITMENTLVDGYVSEKLFNGALGGGIPIYFGANDVGKYVNQNSFIHCNVSREVIDEMRSFYPRRPRPRPFLFKKNSTVWPTDEELLSWADGYLRPQLEPCVKRVIELDNNDEDYLAVLKEPFILNKDIMSGQYPLRGVALAYDILRNTETYQHIEMVHAPANA